MGCWYETCNVSHLPIVTGDEIVIIPLLKRNHPHELGFYVDDLYVPLSLPIYGKYDDDFGFVDCTTCKKAEEYLLSLEFKDKDTDNIYANVESPHTYKWDSSENSEEMRELEEQVLNEK